MSTPLPAATDDLEQARDDLQTHGCAFVSNALSQDELRALRKRLVDQAAGERKAGVATIEPPNNQRVWNLISKGQEFRELVLNPPIHELVRSLIGEDSRSETARPTSRRPVATSWACTAISFSCLPI